MGMRKELQHSPLVNSCRAPQPVVHPVVGLDVEHYHGRLHHPPLQLRPCSSRLVCQGHVQEEQEEAWRVAVPPA